MTTAQEHEEILESLAANPNPHADLIASAQEIDRRWAAEEKAKRVWL